MRATVMFGAGDVRIENVPDAPIVEPTDAVVTVTRACICGSDLWPYQKMEQSENGRLMGHEAIGIVEAVCADVRTSRPVGAMYVYDPAVAAAQKSWRDLPDTATLVCVAV
jgi:threonine dehydrogenase-like Zn-dependent dehydrogenase